MYAAARTYQNSTHDHDVDDDHDEDNDDDLQGPLHEAAFLGDQRVLAFRAQLHLAQGGLDAPQDGLVLLPTQEGVLACADTWRMDYCRNAWEVEIWREGGGEWLFMYLEKGSL